MKVKELIEKLQKFDGELEVYEVYSNNSNGFKFKKVKDVLIDDNEDLLII